jgi:CheY-like chemotaxis protein
MGAVTPRILSRVLVVEDSRTQAAALGALLEEHGYSVTIARSGEEALDLVPQQTFDVVISDVVMPGIDGFELCRRLKEQAAPRVLPTTTRPSPTTRASCWTACSGRCPTPASAGRRGRRGRGSRCPSGARPSS